MLEMWGGSGIAFAFFVSDFERSLDVKRHLNGPIEVNGVEK